MTAQNPLDIYRYFGPRKFSIWANNFYLIFWYHLVNFGYLSRGLATRFGSLWLISSTNNLIGEHLSKYDTLHRLDFVRDFTINAEPFVLGMAMIKLNLPIGILVWLFVLSCVVYCVNIFLRYHLDDHKTHRYSLYCEILVHTPLLPVLAYGILAPEMIDPNAIWNVCVACDIVLKLGRTVFIWKWNEPAPVPSHGFDGFQKQDSWNRPLSQESFFCTINQFSNFDFPKLRSLVDNNVQTNARNGHVDGRLASCGAGHKKSN